MRGLVTRKCGMPAFCLFLVVLCVARIPPVRRGTGNTGGKKSPGVPQIMNANEDDTTVPAEQMKKFPGD